MLSDVFSSANVCVAARYAEQIRQLLALSVNHLNAQRTVDAISASAGHVPSPAAGAQGSVVDFRT